MLYITIFKEVIVNWLYTKQLFSVGENTATKSSSICQTHNVLRETPMCVRICLFDVYRFLMK